MTSRLVLLAALSSACLLGQAPTNSPVSSPTVAPQCTATLTTNCTPAVANDGTYSPAPPITQIGAVPTTTTVNSHALSGNVVVTAADITTGILTPLASTCYLTANIGATNSATPANVCAGWPMAASKSYGLHCQIAITYVTSATVAFTLAGPGSPASWAMRYDGLTGASAIFEAKNAVGTTSYTALTTGAPGNVTEIVLLDAAITNGSTASGTNLTLTTKGNGTNNYNVLKDSYCTLMQLN